jgi:hypothetical protein
VFNVGQSGSAAIILNADNATKEVAAVMTMLGCSSVLLSHDGIPNHDNALLCLNHILLGDLEKGVGKVAMDLSLQVGTLPLCLYGLNTRCAFSPDLG